jgi:hypothetical protein
MSLRCYQNSFSAALAGITVGIFQESFYLFSLLPTVILSMISRTWRKEGFCPGCFAFWSSVRMTRKIV